MLRPDVVAAAHAHSIYGKTWSSLGRLLDPIIQDACAFYEDHSLFADYTGVVYDVSEGDRIAEALGNRKAVILQNHDLLTVGHTVDEVAWFFISMEGRASRNFWQKQLESRFQSRMKVRSPPRNKWERRMSAGFSINRYGT
jgi:ribulose-5-phosphate 4-epimerase/fuculose-1-phosphate aldolase